MPEVKSTTPFQEFCGRWKKWGCGSGECPGPDRLTTKVCLLRGSVPCDILFIGEAPGECITGDSLVETAFRDKRSNLKGIPIKDLVGQSGFQVYCVDDKTKQLTLGTVKRVWHTGYKKVYRVSFFWWGAPPHGKGGRHKYFGDIKVTSNHPFLLKSGEYCSLDQGLEVGNRLQPFYRFCSGRRHRVGLHSGSMIKEAVFLLEKKIGRPLIQGEQAHHHDRNPENDAADNLELLDIAEHARLHGFEDNAMDVPKHRETHSKAMKDPEYRAKQSRMMSKHLADPENRRKRLEQIQAQRKATSETVKKKFATDPVYYYRYLVGRVARDGSKLTERRIREKMAERFPNEPYPPKDDNHVIHKIEELGHYSVYDMEVEGHHNFVANGVVVHNSENAMGYPFIGPAGLLLDNPHHPPGIIQRAGLRDYRLSFTNLVGCIPRDDLEGGKASEPEDDQVKACAGRLVETVELCSPKLIVCVGRLAKDWLDPEYRHNIAKGFGRTIPTIDIVHPAAILRANQAQRGLMVQRSIVLLRNAAIRFCEPVK